MTLKAIALAQPVIDNGGPGSDPSLLAACDSVNKISEMVVDCVKEQTEQILQAGRIPAIIGGDHSIPFGAIVAASVHVRQQQQQQLGVLHIDAHCDLR